jgi:hypothetical protein
VERGVASGRVAGAVAKLSRRADLLVIGSRGYGPVRRVALGTHTGRIMRAASTPVLVLSRCTGEQLDERVVLLAAGGRRRSRRSSHANLDPDIPPSEAAMQATRAASLFTVSPTRGGVTRWRRQQLTAAARRARSRTSSESSV